jgi:hypothetical protein
VGGFSTVGDVGGIQVFKTTRTTDFSTTSTTWVSVFSMTFNLLAKSNLLIYVQPKTFAPYGYNNYQFVLDGSSLRNYRASSHTSYSSYPANPLMATALNIAAGQHTIDFQMYVESTTLPSYVYSPIDLVVIAFPR